MHVCRDAAVLYVRAWEQQMLDQPQGCWALLLRLLFLSIHHAHLFLLLRPRKREWRSKENTTPRFLSPSSASEQQAERGTPAQPSIWGVLQVFILGNWTSQSPLLC